MNSELTKEKLVIHMGHNVTIVGYGSLEQYENIALECHTCNEVLSDTDVNKESE